MQLGTSKQKMTYFKPGVGMFGYGKYEHQAKGVQADLYARAFVLKNKDQYLAIVSAEFLSCTISIKQEVLKNLKAHFNKPIFTQHNLNIHGNHTHSAAGGYAHYPFYNFSTSGFCPSVFKTYSQAITKSIIEAFNEVEDIKVTSQKSEFDQSVPVAFNRALKAYNANKDVKQLAADQEHLAINRTMQQLVFKDGQNKLKGLLNFFGVHTTCLGNDQYKISPDSKGFAAVQIEEKYGVVAGFSQSACGDVSPHFSNQNNQLKTPFSELNDAYDKPKINGAYQFELASKMLQGNLNERSLKASFDCYTQFFDLTNIKIDEKYKADSTAQTYSAALGLSFFKGTNDGRGADGIIGILLGFLVTVVHFLQSIFGSDQLKEETQDLKKHHTSKNIVMQTSQRKVLGAQNFGRIPKGLDKMVDVMIDHYKNGSLKDYPLTPDVLPMQLIKIGDLALACLPGEITITAAKRLKASIQSKLNDCNEVWVISYSNAYSGYVTTPEEYRQQTYEGGHTLFGENTLGAYQTCFDYLVKQLNLPPEERVENGVHPPVFDAEVIAKRTNSNF